MISSLKIVNKVTCLPLTHLFNRPCLGALLHTRPCSNIEDTAVAVEGTGQILVTCVFEEGHVPKKSNA